MSQLPQETARLQTDLQAAETDFANCTQQQQSAQQALTSAQAQVTAAQANLAVAEARIPALEAAVADADARVEDLQQQILDASEPDQEIPGRPGRPNPAQLRRLAELRRQLAQAQAAAANARTALNNGRAAVTQAGAALQAAQDQANGAATALQAAQAAVAAAEQRRQAVQQQLDRIARWNAQISADPLDRPALQQTEQELAEQAAALEEACDWARSRLEIEQETLTALTVRRNLLTTELQPIADALPGATAKLQAAQQALDPIARRLASLYKRGPRP